MVAESMHKNALKMKKLLIESVKAIGEHNEEFVEEGKKAKVFFPTIFTMIYHFKGIGDLISNGRWQEIGLRAFELIQNEEKKMTDYNRRILNKRPNSIPIHFPMNCLL